MIGIEHLLIHSLKIYIVWFIWQQQDMRDTHRAQAHISSLTHEKYFENN